MKVKVVVGVIVKLAIAKLATNTCIHMELYLLPFVKKTVR